MQRSEPTVIEPDNSYWGYMGPGLLQPFQYKWLENSPKGVFCAPCSAPADPKRPALCLVVLEHKMGPGMMTAAKAKWPPEGVELAPLGYKCVGKCGESPCVYRLPEELLDPTNPQLIDWRLVACGAVTLDQVPDVFVVKYPGQ